MEETLAQLRARVDNHDQMLRGNGTLGLNARVRALEDERKTLEAERKEFRSVVREWNDLKSQLKGAKIAFIIASIILGLLGGGFGIAILEALQRIAREMP